MFIEKLTTDQTVVHCTKRARFILRLVLLGFLGTVLFWSASLSQKGMKAAAAALTDRCMNCITWPTSDLRLDTAHGDKADINATRLTGLAGLPLVLTFGVADNANLLPNYQVQYNWDYSCNGSHDNYLSDQAAYITSYNPTFFTGATLDSVTQYERFLTFFHTNYPNSVMGSYVSSSICVDGTSHPAIENYYPANIVDCRRLEPKSPTSLATRPFNPYCATNPGRWHVNVARPEIRARFQENLTQIVKATEPMPPFIFLDNASYFTPEFAWWRTGEKALDCRDRSSAGNTECVAYHTALATEFGPNLYFDDFIEHYRTLVARLEQAGVRSILNFGTPAAVMAYERDRLKYTQQLEELIGTNGIAFEYPFQYNLRTNATDTGHEIEFHRRLLSQGKLVIFYADYQDIRASSWMAGMAMLLKSPGQSLFVARAPEAAPLWSSWPVAYGQPGPVATFRNVQYGNPNLVGHHWSLQRSFQHGEILVGHLGVSMQPGAQTFPVTQLAPALTTQAYTLIHAPRLGVWDTTTQTYTANQQGVDYFTLGAQCDNAGFCQKLIALSVRVFK